MASVFQIGNGIFQHDKAPYHNARSVLEGFQEYGAEFQLMPWPPNSPDLNPVEHICNVKQRQL